MIQPPKRKFKKNKKRKYIIEYCRMCPFSHTHAPFHDCSHPDNDEYPKRIFWKDFQDGYIPDWCPLEMED